MPQPTTAIPAWASNATFNSGIESGLPPTLAFTAEEQTQGLKPGKVVARKLNWLFKVLCDWTAWISFSKPNFVDGSTHDMTGTCRVNGGTLDWRGNTALGNNSTAHTHQVTGVQTYTGEETHNGGETHNGASVFATSIIANPGADRTAVALWDYAVAGAPTTWGYNDGNTFIVSGFNGSDRTITLTESPAPPEGVKIYFKHGISSDAHKVIVRRETDSASLLVLDTLQGGFVFSKNGRWY